MRYSDGEGIEELMLKKTLPRVISSVKQKLTDCAFFGHSFVMTPSQLHNSHSEQASVPIIANGDVYCREDMQGIKNASGATGVMLARGALYNLSVFKKDSQLLNQESVVKSYLGNCVKYSNHVANSKYVICEMINGRRMPLALRGRLSYDSKNRTVGEVCKCKSLDELVKLWDVNVNVIDGGGSNDVPPTLRNYDDNYFLNSKRDGNDGNDEPETGKDKKRQKTSD